MVEWDVVSFGGDEIDDLQVIGKADGAGVRALAGEQAVVIAAAAAESRVVTSEAESGAEDEVELFRRCDGGVGGRFENAESAGDELVLPTDGVEGEE